MGVDTGGGMYQNIDDDVLGKGGNTQVCDDNGPETGYENFRTNQYDKAKFAYSVHKIIDGDSFQGLENFEEQEYDENTPNKKVQSNRINFKSLALAGMLLPGLAAPALARTCNPVEAKEYNTAKSRLRLAQRGIDQNTPRKLTYAREIAALEQQIATAKASGGKLHPDIPRNLVIKKRRAAENTASIKKNDALRNKHESVIKGYDQQETCPEISDPGVGSNVVTTYDGINHTKVGSTTPYDKRKGRQQQYEIDWSKVDGNGISPRVKVRTTVGHRTTIRASVASKKDPYNDERPVDTLSIGMNYQMQPTNKLVIGLNIADLSINNGKDYPYQLKSGASYVQFSTVIGNVRQTFRLAGAPHGQTVTGSFDFGKHGVIETRVVKGNDGMFQYGLRYVNNY